MIAATAAATLVYFCAMAAQAGVIFEFVPDDPANADIVGLIEIMDDDYAARRVDYSVLGDLNDFQISFLSGSRFPSSSSFGLGDLDNVESFVMIIDPMGDFISVIEATTLTGSVEPFLSLLNTDGDTAQISPTGIRFTDVISSTIVFNTAGTFQRVQLFEPKSAFLFIVGLLGLIAVGRWRRLHNTA